MNDDRVSFHPDAAVELDAALAWYAARSVKAADQFIVELDRAIAVVLESREVGHKSSDRGAGTLCGDFPS